MRTSGHARSKLMPVLEPSEFLNRLKNNDFPTSTRKIAIGGIAKLDDADASVILLAPSLSCSNWFPIPLSIIDSVETLRMVKCKDHNHPLVRIIFKQNGISPEAVGLLSVIASLQSFITRAITARKSGPPVVRDASDDCAIVSTEDDLLLCCMDASNEVNCAPVLKVLKPD
jgi:hypothetical protein